MASRAKSRRIRFNQGAIERLSAPDSGRTYVFDDSTPSLAVCITANGAKIFYLSRRIDGKPSRIRIGPFPQTSVKQAQSAAAKLNGKIAHGENPQAERRAARGSETLKEIFDRYIEAPTRRKQPKAARTVEGYREQWEAHLAAWADRKIGEISTAQVDKLHSDIGEGKDDDETRHYMANRVLALLCALFEYAIRDGARIVNPCKPVERYPEASRSRAIQPSEMPDYLAAVEAEPDERMRDFFAVLLFTGARRRNVEAMRWDEIDLKRRSWTVCVKGNKTIDIPLVDELVAMLKRRQRHADGSEWVFPAQGKSGHVVEPRPQWRRILKAAGISDLRIHDLRRTLASWMADTGATETIIGGVLGHSPQSITGIYARVGEDAKREAMQRAVDAMLRTTKTTKKKGGQK